MRAHLPAIIAITLVATLVWVAPRPISAAPEDCQVFPETGKTVCGNFLTYWRANGGLAQQGLPLTDAFNERNATDGRSYTVQYFERARFEAHPENPAPYNVLLGLLGREQLLARYGASTPPGQAGNPLGDECASFAETGKRVCGRFLAYWRGNGALAQQGLPLTDLILETNPTNGQQYVTQYFERARFEYHPEQADPRYQVLLGLLGREQFLARYPDGVPIGTTPDPLGTPPSGWRTYLGHAKVPFAIYYPPDWTLDESHAAEGRIYFYAPGVKAPINTQTWVLVATQGTPDPTATIESLRDQYYSDQIKANHPEAAIDIVRYNRFSGLTFASLGTTFTDGDKLCYAYIGIALKEQVPWRFRLNTLYDDYDQNLDAIFSPMIGSLNIHANPSPPAAP